MRQRCNSCITGYAPINGETPGFPVCRDIAGTDSDTMPARLGFGVLLWLSGQVYRDWLHLIGVGRREVHVQAAQGVVLHRVDVVHLPLDPGVELFELHAD